MTNYGDRRIGYKMQCYDSQGRSISEGWANADTIEKAREWAEQIMRPSAYWKNVALVVINGAEWEFRGHAWVQTGRERTTEKIWRTVPFEYSPGDLTKECYPTTVMDYFEIVHERRVDGSCRCGHHAVLSHLR